MPFIKSLDTSNPVMAALDNTYYEYWGLSSKPKANMNDFFNTDRKKVYLSDILLNVSKFRKINNLD
jgi:hypothetical protein